MPAEAPHDPETGEILASPVPQPVTPPAAAPPAETPLPVPAPPASVETPTSPPKAPSKPRARPPANSGEIAVAVAEAQAKLAEAGSTGAFARDPYRIVLAGLSVTLGVFPKVTRRIEDSLSGAVVELGNIARSVRHPLTDAERAMLQRDVVQTIDQAARSSIGAAAASLPRAMNLRSAALAVSAAAISLALVGTGAFYAGRASASNEVRATAAAQRADLVLAQEQIGNLPLAEARAWALLVRANPAVREAVSKAQQRQVNAAGQTSGLVPLWLDAARVPPSAR